MQAFNNLVDNTLDDLQETFVCSTIADVEQLQEDHENFKTDSLKDAETKYNELAALTEQMAELGSTDNTYTTLTPTVGRTCAINDSVHFSNGPYAKLLHSN